jgi:hypothetical protein
MRDAHGSDDHLCFDVLFNGMITHIAPFVIVRWEPDQEDEELFDQSEHGEVHLIYSFGQSSHKINLIWYPETLHSRFASRQSSRTAIVNMVDSLETLVGRNRAYVRSIASPSWHAQVKTGNRCTPLM